MRPIPFFAAVVHMFFLMSCGAPAASSDTGTAKDTETPQSVRPDLKPGEIHDLAQGYSIYLPANYPAEKSTPVIFFFDAHARGRLPLKRYAPLADANGIILVGSNRSKNGLPPQQSLQIAGEMITDVQQKWSPDNRRMYTAGFSGGARVAAMTAQNRVDIAAVLACGAGFQPRQTDQFGFVGMVGMEDFNYQEMRQVDRYLEENRRSGLIEYYDGGHDWAPVSIMAKALQWAHFRDMARGSVARNDSAVDNMLVKVRYQDEQLKQNGTAFQRWLLRKRIISYLDGLTDLSGLELERDELRNHPETLAELNRQEDEFQREKQMQQQYVSALQNEDLDYWRRVTGMLQKVARNGSRFDAWLNKRVLNFLSLNAYLNGNSMLQAGALPDADRMLTIYSLVDPENAEHAFLTAILRMKQGQPDDAWASLQQAADLGFAEPDRLQSDPDLAPLRQREAYPAVLQTVQNAAAEQ